MALVTLVPEDAAALSLEPTAVIVVFAVLRSAPVSFVIVGDVPLTEKAAATKLPFPVVVRLTVLPVVVPLATTAFADRMLLTPTYCVTAAPAPRIVPVMFTVTLDAEVAPPGPVVHSSARDPAAAFSAATLIHVPPPEIPETETPVIVVASRSTEQIPVSPGTIV